MSGFLNTPIFLNFTIFLYLFFLYHTCPRCSSWQTSHFSVYFMVVPFTCNPLPMIYNILPMRSFYPISVTSKYPLSLTITRLVSFLWISTILTFNIVLYYYFLKSPVLAAAPDILPRNLPLSFLQVPTYTNPFFSYIGPTGCYLFL